MGKQNSLIETKDTKNPMSSKKTGITTKLLGVDPSKVIPSQYPNEKKDKVGWTTNW